MWAKMIAVDKLSSLEHCLDRKITALNDINNQYENVLNTIRCCVREEICRQKNAESIAKSSDDCKTTERDDKSGKSSDLKGRISKETPDIDSLNIIEPEMGTASLESILAAARQIRQPKSKSANESSEASSVSSSSSSSSRLKTKRGLSSKATLERLANQMIEREKKHSDNPPSRKASFSGKTTADAPTRTTMSPNQKTTTKSSLNNSRGKIASNSGNMTLDELKAQMKILDKFAGPEKKKLEFFPYAQNGSSFALHEAILMTKLTGRPWFPSSDLYDAIVASMDDDSSSTNLNDDDDDDDDDKVANEMALNIDNLKQNFETKIKYKMQSTAADSKEVKKQIFELWLMARGYIKSFEALQSTSKKSSNSSDNFGIIDRNLCGLRTSPSVLPMSFHGKSYLQISTGEWLGRKSSKLNRYLNVSFYFYF